MELMGTILAWVLGLGLVAIAYLFLSLVIGLIKALWSGGVAGQNSAKETADSAMNEGDFHSGPKGYSPNTAYPDTFYGSGGQDEGDFNR